MTDTTSTTNKGELLWLDMETLGLDPAKGQILEVAAVLTDMRANEEINRFSALLPLDEKADVPVWNAITHGGPGGLLSLCAGISRPEQDQAQWTRALDALDLCLVTMVVGCERAPILAGSSVHFDRRWIDAYLPRLSKRLSYRHLDVRAVLMAHAAAGVDHELGQPKAGKLEAAHRAEADIDYSIEMYRRALSWISSTTQPQRDELRRKVDELQPLSVWPERVKVIHSAPLEPCPFCGAKVGSVHVEHCPEIGRDALTEGPSSVRLTGAEDDFCEVCGRAPCDMADEAKGHLGVRLAGGA